MFWEKAISSNISKPLSNNSCKPVCMHWGDPISYSCNATRWNADGNVTGGTKVISFYITTSYNNRVHICNLYLITDLKFH